MRHKSQFTVKQSPKCAVRDDVMDYSCGIASQTFTERPVGALVAEVLNSQVLPVMRSNLIRLFEVTKYRSGLVRLWRRIVVRINSAPSLNCVLVIATQ